MRASAELDLANASERNNARWPLVVLPEGSRPNTPMRRCSPWKGQKVIPCGLRLALANLGGSEAAT